MPGTQKRKRNPQWEYCRYIVSAVIQYRVAAIFLDIYQHYRYVPASSSVIKQALLSLRCHYDLDEGHQLPEAARQMYGKTLGNGEIREIRVSLEKEHQRKSADRPGDNTFYKCGILD